MKKSKGITLIELIVSIVIFSIIIVGAALFNSNNTKATVRSERKAKMILLEEQTIEEFRGWLKSASIPGSRFDGIWADTSGFHVGTAVRDTTDSIAAISVSLEIDSFIPDRSVDVAAAGVRLKIKVVSEDTDLGVINEKRVIYISRHD